MAAIAARSDHAVWVAETAGVVVGWVHAFQSERIASEPYAEVGGLVVDESQRRRGVGTVLLATVEEWAARQGLDHVRIRSNIMREETHKYYQRRGYSEQKRQSVFRKTLAGSWSHSESSRHAASPRRLLDLD